MDNEKNLLVDILEENYNYKYDIAILTSYEFSLSFFEDQLIRALPKDTYLLIDASGYKKALKTIRPSSKYLSLFKNRIILVNFQRGVFHSKIFLFAGKDKSLSYILSSNITKRGFTRNLELVSKFQDLQICLDVCKKIRTLIEKCSGKASEMLKTKILEIENNEFETLPFKSRIFTNESESIFNQFLSQIKGKNFEELYVCSPYLDKNPIKIIKILEKIQVKKKFFIIQNHNEFTIDTLRHFEDANYEFCLFNNIRFLHAKFLYLYNDKVGYLLSGSTNLTKMAMLKTYENGNCESCVLSEINPELFKDEYLKFLDLKECLTIENLDFVSNGEINYQKEKTPFIHESYIENNRLIIEVSGDIYDYVILIYNSQDELIKEIDLKDCIIKQNEKYTTIIFNYDFKTDNFKLFLKKDLLESNQSFFTNAKGSYSREEYIKELFSEDRREINITVLFEQAQREYHDIIEHRKVGHIDKLPIWKSLKKRRFYDIYKLLLKGLKKINEYFERIDNEGLEIKENTYRIEDLINWEIEKLLTIQKGTQDLSSKVDLLWKLNHMIADLEKIKHIEETKEIFRLNLDYWKLSALLMYLYYIQKQNTHFIFKIYSIMKISSPDILIDSEELVKLLQNKSKILFFPELLEKIENDNYFSKKSIDQIKEILVIINYLNSSDDIQPPASLAKYNIKDDDDIKDNFRNKGSAFCPKCESFLRSRIMAFVRVLFCKNCNEIYKI